MNASGLIICETVSFLFAVLMPLERPRRQVRRAPYLPVGTGLPRPPARLCLPSVRKSAVVGTTDSKDDPIEARARADTLPVRLASGKLGEDTGACAPGRHLGRFCEDIGVFERFCL